jgi:hypothetical protein
MSARMALHSSTKTFASDSLAEAGLPFEDFDLGNPSDYLMDDDLWFLNMPPLDINGQLPSGI